MLCLTDCLRWCKNLWSDPHLIVRNPSPRAIGLSTYDVEIPMYFVLLIWFPSLFLPPLTRVFSIVGYLSSSFASNSNVFFFLTSFHDLHHILWPWSRCSLLPFDLNISVIFFLNVSCLHHEHLIKALGFKTTSLSSRKCINLPSLS